MRSGVLVRKLGMTRLFLDDGRHCPVTVLSLEGCEVVGQRTPERDGYSAVQVGAGSIPARNAAKPQRAAAEQRGVALKRHVREFRVSTNNLLEPGSRFRSSHFVVGQYVDARGLTIGKGFAGAMKRHNFGGLRASHGVSISHRSHGSTGNSQDPGRVFKGKKMAGQMGARQRTVQNLEVVSTDEERGVILVKGGVPGAPGSWLALSDAVKRALPAGVPYPAGIEKPAGAPDVDDAPDPSEAGATAADRSAPTATADGE